MNNRITKLFGIQYPVIQGGMVWCSGWKLAAAVSNAGGLGLIGSGSMHTDNLREHIQKIKQATDKPFGVNIPLLYPQIDDLINIVIEEEVKIVFTSAGSPKKYTTFLKSKGITVVHVVSSALFAKKCEEAGCDAVVAEGFEAGGHNGREETTTLSLIPEVRESINIPLIAAGGIGSGKSMFAVLALGAEGVQIGSAFAISEESSAHIEFKKLVCESKEGDTILSLKQLAPARLIKNKFYTEIKELEDRGASKEEIKEHLGKGRAKKGIFEGNLEDGELEIGQVSSQIKEIRSVKDIMQDMISDFNNTSKNLANIKL
ncbi:MAG: nitronate monooxygenase [Marinifilaceae bacterium]